ncbi:hypothetical protein [Aeromonas veronii]|uniref:hypothetical protein n=1 Tax=Aeromonas veronii TaxID=654 RepID=UPI00224613B8|nr:hypothetical protein [Aeromonas veronii]MCX0438198.1 hypothetical protein [Aeromonas veronii]
MTSNTTQKAQKASRKKPERQLSHQQIRSLRQLIARLPPERKDRDEAAFLFSFISAESLLRSVWAYYRQTPETPMTLQLPEIKKSLKHFNIQVNEQALETLLGSSSKRGQKSARNLRNGMAHHWQKEDCAEAVARLSEFQRCVDHLIEQIEPKIRKPQ